MNIHNNNSSNDVHFPFERFASIRRYTTFDFLKRDGSWIVYSADITGQFNLWRQRSFLGHEGQPYAPHQLTNFTEQVVRAAFPSPIDNSIIFFADLRGDENFQIYRVDDAFNGWAKAITNNSNIKYEWGLECFCNSGTRIVYSSNEQSASDMLIYVLDIDQNRAVCITGRSGWYMPGYWSSDDKKINCVQIITDSDSVVWLIDIEKRQMKLAETSNGSIIGRNVPGPWSHDGSGFYILTDQNSENIYLAYYDLYSSKIDKIISFESDIECLELSSDGMLMVWSINKDGYSDLYTKYLYSAETQKLDLKRKGVIKKIRISPDNKKIGLLMTTSKSPYDIYIFDLQSQNLEKLTNSLFGNIPENMIIEPKLIRYKSFDSLEISSFLYKPKNASSNKKCGALLSIHGGPIAQERPEYSYGGLYQFLVNYGIAILSPNFRGSTGYGRSFEKKIYHDWGGKELKDLEYAIKWLLSQDWVDKTKLGAFGASYGGFGALSCASRLSHYNWKAVVDIFGPSNLITTLTTAPAHWKNADKELIGDPEKEEGFLRDRSPINYINNIKADLLIIQGATDPRVVKDESDQIVNGLRELGRNVEYLIFEDEGHGFANYSNMIKAYKSTADFLARKLS
jgi:dipeptidyl aminopeptidase/acylaminoacyl peptidase